MTTRRRGPWKKISSKIVYRNRWIQVREDQVVRPNGQPGIYGVVEMTPAVGIVAVTTDERVHLVGQYRYATECFSWEVVTGFCDSTEQPLSAARRELREETGLSAGQWMSLGTCHVSNSVTNQVGYLYLAQDLVDGVASPDETEDLTWRIVPLGEALRLAQVGDVTQGFSLVALFRAWHHLRGDFA